MNDDLFNAVLGYPNSSRIVVCKKCSKRYQQECEEQEPGFRDMSYDVCPYCGNENDRSMQVDFFNSTINTES